MLVLSTKIEPHWLKSANEDECSWCIAYLGRKGILFDTQPDYNDPIPTIQEHLRNMICRLNTTAEGREHIRKMRSAWSQKKFRNKAGKKSYNFVMSTRVQSKLLKLAKEMDKPIGEALEEVILGYEVDQEKKRE